MAEFSAFILSSLAVTSVLTVPPEFFPSICCRLPEKQRTQQMCFNLYFLFLYSVSTSLCNESVGLYPGKLHVSSQSLGSIFCPQIETGTYLCACGLFLRVDCKFMSSIRAGQSSVVIIPSPGFLYQSKLANHHQLTYLTVWTLPHVPVAFSSEPSLLTACLQWQMESAGELSDLHLQIRKKNLSNGSAVFREAPAA